MSTLAIIITVLAAGFCAFVFVMLWAVGAAMKVRDQWRQE